MFSEEEFKAGFQMFLLFLISQFFGPLFSLVGILPLNISLIWSPISATISAAVVMVISGYRKKKKIMLVAAYGWILIISLNAMSYVILGLLLSVTSFFYLSVCLYLYMISGMYLGRALRPYLRT